MFFQAFKKESSIRHFIAYFTLLCFLFTSQTPSKLSADECCPSPYSSPSPCVLVEQEDVQRTKTATIVAGATIIALVGGVAWLAFGSSCHKGHHSSHSSSSSSSYSNYSSDSRNSYDSDYSNHHNSSRSSHRHHHHRRHSSSYSNSYGVFEDEVVTNRHADRVLAEQDGNHPARSRRLARAKKLESNELSGAFVVYPQPSASGQGSLTAFVRLPDGTTQVIGSLSCSDSTGASLPYGPFKQKGEYVFGVSLNEKMTFPGQCKIGSLEVNVNGLTVENHDFFVPAHSPINYEPAPCDYMLF